MVALLAPFNAFDAELALICLWRDVARSKREDPESTNLSLPLSPLIEPATARAVTASSEVTDTTTPIRIRTGKVGADAAHHLLTVSRSNHTEIQYVVLSLSPEFIAADLAPEISLPEISDTRQLIALNIPTDVAKRLLFFPSPTAVASASSSFTESDAAHQLPTLSKTKSLDSISSSNSIEEDDLVKNLGLSETVDTIHLVPIQCVFSDAEEAVAPKLINLLACSDTKRLYTAVGFSEDEFLAAHSLLDRFTSPKRQGPLVCEFSSEDVAAVHQLRALFASDNPERAVGPIFLAVPDAEESPLRLMPLSHSKRAALCLLQELY